MLSNVCAFNVYCTTNTWAMFSRIMVVGRPKFQPVQGRMLTTDTCSPLQRFSPASHSLIVWFSPSAPTRMHTFAPGFEQSAESLQRHSLVWSKKKKKKSLYKSRHLVLNLEFLHILLSPPSQRSHMWHLVQPVVLRSGHLQTLSSAIR